MTFALRPYQSNLIGEARQMVREGKKSVLMVAPTGAGKTAISASMIGTCVSRGQRAWFINHRRELIKQSSRTFRKVGIEHGIVSSGVPMNPRAPAQICGIDTLKNRLENLPPPSMIFWDECHHVAAAGWSKVFSEFPDIIHIGVTATPCRLDGAGLGDWFQGMVETFGVRWLIDEGYLTPYKLYGAPPVDTAGLKKSRGDYAVSEAAERVDRPSITGNAVEHYLQHCRGKRAIVFAMNIEHSRHVVEQFNASGVVAEHLDGTMPVAHRDAILAAFERGEISVLSNVDLFGEGFDLPGLDAVIQLRLTMSLGLYLQMVGRCLRPVYAPGFDLNTAAGRRMAIAAGPKPHAFILDHVGNWVRHGMPDEDREWNLDPKVKVAKAANDNEEDVKFKQCPECFNVHEPAPACPDCGHQYEAQRRPIQEVEGELVEIDPEIARRQKKAEQAKAKSLADLIELAQSRNYENPAKWAKHVFDSRKQKEDNRMMRYG